MKKITKKTLLNEYKKHLEVILNDVKEELVNLKGNGNIYDEEALQESIDNTLASFRHEYKEQDFLDFLDDSYINVLASNNLDNR